MKLVKKESKKTNNQILTPMIRLSEHLNALRDRESKTEKVRTRKARCMIAIPSHEKSAVLKLTVRETRGISTCPPAPLTPSPVLPQALLSRL
jgi:hypothetical protein